MGISVEESDLARDLAQVQKGQGLGDFELATKVGSALAAVCGIEADDTYAIVREKITSAIASLANDMDDRSHDVLKAELNMEEKCQEPLLGLRREWLADKLDAAPSTIRAWGDKATKTAASLLAHRYNKENADVGIPPSLTNITDRHQYTVERLVRTSFYQDRLLRRTHFQRTIKARIDGLSRLDTEFRLMRNIVTSVTVENCIGCKLTDVVSKADGLVVCSFELPRPLEVGAEHTIEYEVAPIAYQRREEPRIIVWTTLFQPELTIRAKFDPPGVPTSIWKVDGLTPIMVPGNPEECPSLELDLGATGVQFSNVLQGRAYGMAWRWPNDSTSVA